MWLGRGAARWETGPRLATRGGAGRGGAASAGIGHEEEAVRGRPRDLAAGARDRSGGLQALVRAPRCNGSLSK